MGKLKYLFFKYRHFILIIIFFCSSFLAVKVSDFLVSLLADEFYINRDLLSYISTFILFLIVGLVMFTSVKLILSFEEKLVIKLKKEIEDGYPLFIRSLQDLKNVHDLPFFEFNYTHEYRLLYEDNYIVLRLTKQKMFEIYWYKKETNHLISTRTIYYEKEPTIQVALTNGP